MLRGWFHVGEGLLLLLSSAIAPWVILVLVVGSSPARVRAASSAALRLPGENVEVRLTRADGSYWAELWSAATEPSLRSATRLFPVATAGRFEVVAVDFDGDGRSDLLFVWRQGGRSRSQAWRATDGVFAPLGPVRTTGELLSRVVE